MVNFIIKNFKKIVVLVSIIILAFIIVVASYHYVLEHDITEDSSNTGNVPSEIRSYSNSVRITEDGQMELGQTASQLWAQLQEEHSDILRYINSPEELARIVNVQVASESLYTGTDPEHAVINTRRMAENIDQRNVQGIIKLKRAFKDPNDSNKSKEIYMEYKSPEEFRRLIDRYNETKSAADRLEAMKYFTLERKVTSDGISGNSALPTSLDGMLVIGDSIAGCILRSTDIESQGATVVYKTSASPEYFLGEQNLSTDGARTPSSGSFDMERDLASITNPTGIYLILGQNSCWSSHRLDNMRRLVEKLQEKYPNIPIYINSVIPKAQEESSEYNRNATAMNLELKDYCDSVADIYYSDVLEGYKERVNEFAGGDRDKIHPNNAGANILYDNIKKNIEEIARSNQNGTSNMGRTSNQITTSNSTNTTPSHWPIPGHTTLTSLFGYRDAVYSNGQLVADAGTHSAIDITASEGTNIEAPENGTVVEVSNETVGGNYVIIDHGNGFRTMYFHMSAFSVSKGDIIAKGDVIGKVGKTGTGVTGAHLHFVVEENGERVDPLLFRYDNETQVTYEGTVYETGNGPIGTTVVVSGRNYEYVAKVARYYETEESGNSTDSNETVEVADPTFEMTEQEVDYKSLTRPYAMPFNYLWTMLVITQNKEFVFDLADLVYNSKMEITIRDNESINKIVKTDSYQRKNTFTTRDIYVSVTYGGTTDRVGPRNGGTTSNISPSSDGTYTITHTRTVKSDDLDIGLTLADSWCAKTEQEYEYEYKPEHNTGSTSNNIADETISTTVRNDDPGGLAEAVRSQIKSQYIMRGYNRTEAVVTSSKTDCKYEIINRVQTTKNYLTESKYIDEPAKTEENIDPVNEKAKFSIIYNNNQSAKNKIYDEWLFEFLEQNEDTKDLSDLTRYLLYKASGHYYGEHDFETTWTKYVEGFEELEDLGGASGIDGIQGQIYDNLLAKGIPPVGVAAIMGNIQHESSFDPTVQNSIGASGLCQWLGGRFDKLKKFAASHGKDWTDVDIQMDYLWEELNEPYYKHVKDVILAATKESDLQYASWYWEAYFEVHDGAYLVGFEASKDWEIEKKRYEYSKKWYNEWKTHHTSGTFSRASFTEVKTQEQADRRTKELNKMLNTEVHGGWNNPTGRNLRQGQFQSGPFPEYWQSSYIVNHGGSRIQEFQCTWYAYGRASQYLAESGIRKDGYPTSHGDGKDYYGNNKWFKGGKKPKVHALISTTGINEHGHVAFVEGVTSEGIWVSHAGSGNKWYGVTFKTNSELASSAIGYIYLDEPLK